ncbi:MAG: lytic transglycosylase domain-containing protein [Gammaproteobacteria bacterium]|jgi:soluble lytic murein transglycosylase-like protein|nr:transglycosylase [Chromatiales bacterium]MDP6675451.1 lytic transglycosylase domain-containing protein [Gammaproteobacteria bacterium]
MFRLFKLLLSAATLTGILALPVSNAAESPDPVLRQRLHEAMLDSTSFPNEFAAQVWLTDMAIRLGNQVADPRERVAILKRVHQEASRVELPPEMVLAVIDIESAFDAYAVSVAGAQGLMQVMPFWLDEIGRPGDRLIEVSTNLRMGCTILKYYFDMENGDWTRALARYNGSLGSRKYPEKVLNRLRSRWFQQ